MDKNKVYTIPRFCLMILSFVFFMVILSFSSTIGFKNNILISLPFLSLMLIYTINFINYRKNNK
ncbi:Uncharacterised protein [Staphylococcus simiae]|nr:Uncharacterised protein [Staphylococcus simiae]